MKKIKLIGSSALAIIAVAAIILILSHKPATPGQYDDFAACLSQHQIKMYGAYWCSHCQQQKDMLGSSFNRIDYVECSLANKSGQTAVCQQAEIKAYPTWEFADGERSEGVLSLEQLSQKSGCDLIINNPTAG